MKKKKASPIPTPLPSCGELFHFLVSALDLHSWSDAFTAAESNTRDCNRAAKVSDQLRDWAREVEDRAPGRGDFLTFIETHVKVHSLPQADELVAVLQFYWNYVLWNHSVLVRENATFLDRDRTREWCASWQAPGYVLTLCALQQVLLHFGSGEGPILRAPLHELVELAWRESPKPEAKPHFPLQARCYAHYASSCEEGEFNVDGNALKDWGSGKSRPSMDSLGRRFAAMASLEKQEMVLNFAFAGVVESLAALAESWIRENVRQEARRMLLRQAECIAKSLEPPVTKVRRAVRDLSVSDLCRLVVEHLNMFYKFLGAMDQGRMNVLELRLAPYRVFSEYLQKVTLTFPDGFMEFHWILDALWKATRLNDPRVELDDAAAVIDQLRRFHPNWCAALAGPFFAMEGRLILIHELPSKESLQRAFTAYQRAVAAARYTAGTYTATILREGLGLAALLHRRGVGDGYIKPWINKALDWWNLLGFGNAFDHEQPEQRIERAEHHFLDQLCRDIRLRLNEALPNLGLYHWHIQELTSLVDPEWADAIRKAPLNKRQRNPMTQTFGPREQSPLMEAIDREELDYAQKLVRKGAGLNFINSTGDTCLTKAFAREAFDLVLEILQRTNDPIRRETILRVTEKKRLSGLEETLAYGRGEILRELGIWKEGRGEVIDFDRERIEGQTPLYYTVNLLGTYSHTTEELLRLAPISLPKTNAMAPVRERLATGKWSQLELEILEAVRIYYARKQNVAGIHECLDCLIQEFEVDLDAPNVNDHTALTFAAELGLRDVVATLLAAGASVNHSIRGGGTALAIAVERNDFEMARLLLEWGADYRLFVEGFGRPIFAMTMSDRLRELIPYR